MACEATVLPAHVEDTIRAIATFHADHELQAKPIERLIARLTGLLGRPSSSCSALPWRCGSPAIWRWGGRG